jgi:hypothetical protein
MRHPLYTSVALPVLSSLGFLLDTWLGAVIGVVMYVATPQYASAEERQLADRFGSAWSTIPLRCSCRVSDDRRVPGAPSDEHLNVAAVSQPL